MNHFTIFMQKISLSTLFFYFLDKTKCLVNIDGRILEKPAGDIWNSPSDLCLKHTCEIKSNGTAVESTFREYCFHECNNVSF